MQVLGQIFFSGELFDDAGLENAPLIRI